MPLRSQIKLNAKFILKKNWLKACAVLTMLFLLCIGLSALEVCFAQIMGIEAPTHPQSMTMAQLVSYEKTTAIVIVRMLPLTGIFSVLTFLLAVPLFMGMLEWYWRLTDNKPVGIGDVFAWFGSFKLYGRSFALFLNILLRLLPFFIVCLALPYALALYGLYILDTSNAFLELLSEAVMSTGVLLAVAGFFLFLYISMRYFLAPFLMAEDPERKTRFCIRESLALSKGLRWQMFVFNLSFLGWFLLLLICIGFISIFAIFPAMYILPYYFASCAVYAKYLIFSGRVKRRQAEGKEDKPAQAPHDTVEFRA